MAKEINTIGVLTSGGDAPGMKESERNQAWIRWIIKRRNY